MLPAHTLKIRHPAILLDDSLQKTPGFILPAFRPALGPGEGREQFPLLGCQFFRDNYIYLDEQSSSSGIALQGYHPFAVNPEGIPRLGAGWDGYVEFFLGPQIIHGHGTTESGLDEGDRDAARQTLPVPDKKVVIPDVYYHE